ncbi:MAG: hypothetical protein IJO74_01960 [Clostridia bacterium]|nr:hypothetical protein [Clostridia bacterium]
MKQYIIRNLDEKDFSKADTLKIDVFSWLDGYKPETYAQVIFVKGEGFYVRMKCMEKNPRAVYKNYHDPVCNDSCVEFFFNFAPEKQDKYANMEVNALGTIDCSFGSSRHDRVLVTNLWDNLPEIKVEKQEDYWQVEYLLTTDMLEKMFGTINTQSGAVYKANFFKCGDKTEIPHYALWSPVDTPTPDYHRPEFFGELVLE